jgi:hypothetical protein
MMFLAICSMAIVHFNVYSSMCVFYYEFSKLPLPRINGKHSYLGDMVSVRQISQTHSPDDTSRL